MYLPRGVKGQQQELVGRGAVAQLQHTVAGAPLAAGSAISEATRLCEGAKGRQASPSPCPTTPTNTVQQAIPPLPLAHGDQFELTRITVTVGSTAGIIIIIRPIVIIGGCGSILCASRQAFTDDLLHQRAI